MKQFISLVALVAVLASVAGCNTAGRQPQFTRALITPAQLKPGDTAVIEAQVKDRYNIVNRVDGIVKEDPTIRLELQDNGQDPDLKAGDNLWMLKVDVPYQATPGDFLLQITAYREDGTPVPVKTKEGTAPLRTTVPIKILNP